MKGIGVGHAAVMVLKSSNHAVCMNRTFPVEVLCAWSSYVASRLRYGADAVGHFIKVSLSTGPVRLPAVRDTVFLSAGPTVRSRQDEQQRRSGEECKALGCSGASRPHEDTGEPSSVRLQ